MNDDDKTEGFTIPSDVPMQAVQDGQRELIGLQAQRIIILEKRVQQLTDMLVAMGGRLE